MGQVRTCHDSKFHDINCLEMGDEVGFEGCYNGDVNHPDPRPAHHIWLKKYEAEKLYRLFKEQQNTKYQKELLKEIERLEKMLKERGTK